MQMSTRARILDMLPVLLVFALVSAFATFVLMEYVVREPVRVPPPAHISYDEATPAASDAQDRQR